MSQTEERTELVSVWVTKTAKKEIDAAKDNKALAESIVKNYLTSERDWLESEIKEMDDVTIKYKAKLVGIRESFEQAQTLYVEQIEKIYSEASSQFSRLDNVADKLDAKLNGSKKSIEELSKKISYINTDRLVKLLDALDKYESMSPEQKQLISLIIKSE